MTKRMLVVGVMGALALGATAVQAQPKAEPPAVKVAEPAPAERKPAPEMDALKGWKGKVSCEGKLFVGGKEMAYKGTIRSRPELGGFWYPVEYKREKTKDMPAFNGWAMVGYSAPAKKFVMTGYDDWGGWINLTSAGANAGTMVFEGQAAMGDKAVPAKFTMVMDAGGKVKTFTGEFGGQKGFEDNCK